ncbi:protein NLRC3-like isoform X2 [Dysidea avara]
MKDLNRYVKKYAVDWKDIGIELGLELDVLDLVEKDHPHQSIACFQKTLDKWLKLAPNATWTTLEVALTNVRRQQLGLDPVDYVVDVKSSVKSGRESDVARNDAVSCLSTRIQHLNKQIKQRVEKDVWPPNQSKEFIPLVLIQHQNQRTMLVAIKRAEYYQSDYIDDIVSAASNQPPPSKYRRLQGHEPFQKVITTSKVTQEVSDILAPLEKDDNPKFILVEGAPGIGKSFLLKEITYQWGKGLLLQGFKFVILVILRDPFIKRLSSIEELLLSLCKGDLNAKTTASACSDYLFHNDGKDLVFLLDGYDEFPQNLRQKSLIADILNREVLPFCGIIVSSRPHASVYLQEQADVRVDILGFTEADRKQYVQQALEGQPEKIQELTQYLDCHLSINSLCLIPFNIAVLVFLYKNGHILPKNSTDLYERFIFLTICGNLAKLGNSLVSTIPDLGNLPEPCNRIVNQLSKLSLESLNSNKLIFTQDEVEAACPGIISTPGTINGFGLLQTIEHFSFTGKTMTFNFVHLSIQEFLAARYITQLPPADELKVLKEKFWSSYHVNVFAFYVALTNGQHSSFKEFLSEGDNTVSISEKFLDDQIKCFRLFQCFYEAGDNNMCRCIEEAKTFNYKNTKMIELTDSRFMSLTNLECVAFFMTHSVYKNWEGGINFYRCYIQDPGIRMLHHKLVGSSISIRKLFLDCNGLTSSSSSLISDIAVSCKVKVLWIDSNEIVGEDENFYGMLIDPSSKIERLHMSDTKISSAGAIKLFTALATGNKLKELWITSNDISDEACSTIATTLKDNTSLTKLNLGGNPISAESTRLIVKALQLNTTLEELVLPEYTEDERSTIVPLVETVNQIRVIRECQVRLNVKFW